jgi:hypothetical protein
MFRIQSSSLYKKLYKPCNNQDNKLSLPFSSDVLNKNPKLKSILLLSQNYSEKQKVSYNKGSFCHVNQKIEHKNSKSKYNKKILDTQERQEPKELESNNKKSTRKVEVFDTSKYGYYKWKSPSKHRYYYVYIQPTLIGNYSLTKSWGSLENHLGNSITIFYDLFDEISLAIDKISKQRKYKGYNLYDSSE